MNKFSGILLCLSFCIISSLRIGFAQNLKFKHFSNEQGLSQVSVQSILQDSDGFMWFATQDGLNRFDGTHFKIFKNNPSDKSSIASNVIYCLYEDADGLIYIGTQETGFSIYNRYTEKFINYQSSSKTKNVPIPSVRSICASTNKNELLIGTENGLYIFNKILKTFEIVKPNDSDKAFYIMKVFKTEAGKLLIAAPRYGIFEYNDSNNSLNKFYVPQNFNKPDIDFYSMALTNIEEKNSKLYISSFKGGMYVIDSKSGKYVNQINFSNKNDENLNSVKDIKSMPNLPYLYIATSSGLIQYNTVLNSFEIIKHDVLETKSLINNDLLSVYVDDNKAIWVGTYSNGVDLCLNSYEKFKPIKIGNSQEDNSINCFLETQNKTIYVGTDNGLCVYDKNSGIIKKEINSKITIRALAEDKLGNIYIGTEFQGLIIYDSKSKILRNIKPEIFEKSFIYKIVIDHEGAIWIGTANDGLYILNPFNYNFIHFSVNNKLNSNKIFSINNDIKNNSVYLGTGGSGINKLEFITKIRNPLVSYFEKNEKNNSLSSNVVFDIVKSNDSLYWIATNNGLNKFNPKIKSFSNYSEDDGLANNTVWSISTDILGNLWLATNNGLCKFNPNIDNINGSAFKNYDISDGLQGNEFNQGASFVCSDGFILVGGINGFNYFHPNKIKDVNESPKSYIYSISRQGKEIKTDSSIIFQKQLILPYSQNYFSFELGAQNYASPQKLKYSYKLVGKDDDWSSPTNIPFVSYTGLEGGTYTFLAKACNSDGVWSKDPLTFTIIVIPPWYKTTWFYLLTFFSIITSIFGFIRFRTSSIKKENKKLEQRVEKRTKQLAEKNQEITSSIEYAKRIQDAILPAKELIFSKLPDSFILYKPKDIVSGDFYWYYERDEYIIIAAVDCTGHGVPGAFMSMIGHNLLNQIIVDVNIIESGLILEELHKGVQQALKQGQSKIQTNDGMDISFLIFNKKSNEYQWSGAFRNLVILRPNKEIEKIEGNKYSIGGSQSDQIRSFTTHRRFFEPNTMLYLFSDGYADQFGGENEKKFMIKRFNHFLQDICHLPVKKQKDELDNMFNSWKGKLEQVDDVLVIGIRTH